MMSRFGDSASIVYHDLQRDEVRETHAVLIEEIQAQGLMYPVTVIDGMPVYDGAVSYPAVMRAVQRKLEELASSQ